MESFKTVLKSIRPFFVDRLVRNVHFNTNPIGWFLLNQPKITFKWYLNPDGQVNVLVQYWHWNDFVPGSRKDHT